MLPSSSIYDSLYSVPNTSGTLHNALPLSAHSTLSFNSVITSSISGSQASINAASDTNSPELFRQNVKIAHQYVDIIQRLARSCLSGIEHAFHPTSSSTPTQTAADLTTLSHYLSLLEDFLTQTGVGALPLPPSLSAQSDHISPAQLSTEEELLKDAVQKVATLYNRQKQIKDNNNVVASLLSATTHGLASTASSSSSGLPSEAFRR